MPSLVPATDIPYILCFMAKVLVSIDDALLRRIDQAARKRGLTRSAYLSSVAAEDLARGTGPGRQPSARRALRRLDGVLAHTPSGDSTVAIREERDAR
jgi:DNA-binding phage protein